MNVVNIASLVEPITELVMINEDARRVISSTSD